MFVDRLQLVAVDHPADVEVYPERGHDGAAAAAFTLYATRGAHVPPRAVDDHGHDVPPAIAARRPPLPRRLRRSLPIRGYAAPHTLTLDLGADADNAVLLLTGGRTTRSPATTSPRHQRGLRADAAVLAGAGPGAWRTVDEDIGIPGRPAADRVGRSGRASSRRVARGPDRHQHAHLLGSDSGRHVRRPAADRA